MFNATELKVIYDDKMKPICATCTGCGEKMPEPPADLQKSADIIMWLSQKYTEHRSLKHSQEDRRRVSRG
jgi:hypothetical protein